MLVSTTSEPPIWVSAFKTWFLRLFGANMADWVVAGLRLGLGANLLGGGNLYGLYAFDCDDWLLRPVWQFGARWD